MILIEECNCVSSLCSVSTSFSLIILQLSLSVMISNNLYCITILFGAIKFIFKVWCCWPSIFSLQRWFRELKTMPAWSSEMVNFNSCQSTRSFAGQWALLFMWLLLYCCIYVLNPVIPSFCVCVCLFNLWPHSYPCVMETSVCVSVFMCALHGIVRRCVEKILIFNVFLCRSQSGYR